MRSKKTRITLIVVSIFAVNIIGFTLRFYNLDTYFIFFGFRFQLSLLLPFFIIFGGDAIIKIKDTFSPPGQNKSFAPVLWIVVPFILLITVLFLTKIISPGDPDYFYEFGLSSIFDLPLYFIWNLPQLLLFALFLFGIQTDIKRNFVINSLVLVLMFIYLFIPVNKGEIDYYGIISLVFAALSAAAIIKYFPNIYWLCIIIFMVFWLNLLAFGTDSQIMLHILFAAQYSGWEGFFDVAKGYSKYILPGQWMISFMFIISGSLMRKK